MPERHFDFAFDPRYERAARLFGITPQSALVKLAGGELDARYGRWRVRTSVQNIAAVEVTGPYRFIKTAGPPRLGITDRGLSFTPNSGRGVLITFKEPVRGIDPTGHLRHPELTVGVADPEGLAAALAQAMADTR